MSFTTKQWKDRISEYPTRRTLTDTTSSAVSTVTVAREEGTISQEGDAFSATNMNDLETRISNGFSTLSNDSVVLSSTNTTTDSIKFGKDSSNNYGYIIPGADTVTPFKSTLYLGMVVNVSLTGSHTNASYPTKVVYINQTSTMVHLLGTTNLGDAIFTTARAYRWTATLTLGNLSYTINNCMNPTSTQIMTYCSGYQTGFTYWCNDYNYNGSNGWFVRGDGVVSDNASTASARGVLPYIIVNL